LVARVQPPGAAGFLAQEVRSSAEQTAIAATAAQSKRGIVIFDQLYAISDSRFGILAGLRVARRRVIDDLVGINFFAGHTILLVGPPAEVDQLAALRTEGAPGIVLPLNRSCASRTFRHKAKVRRKGRKVKAKSIRRLRGLRKGKESNSLKDCPMPWKTKHTKQLGVPETLLFSHLKRVTRYHYF
jgi:hypothetical protein